MKLVYIDESGSFNDLIPVEELENHKRNSTHFLLTAVIVDVADWDVVVEKLRASRNFIERNFSFPLHECIHATEMMGKRNLWKNVEFKHLNFSKRLEILKYLLNEYLKWKEISIVTVILDKSCGESFISPFNVREEAYRHLFAEVDMKVGDSRYIPIIDGQEDSALLKHLSEQNTARKCLEEALFKRSWRSLFLQMVDHIVYSTFHVFNMRKNEEIAGIIDELDFYKQATLIEVN